MNYMALKRRNMIDLIPYMMNVMVQFALGNRILYSAETKYVIADNHQLVGEKIAWSIVSKMPLETNIIVKLVMYAKEGEGDVVGVGAMKLFDENGFLIQGDQ